MVPVPPTATKPVPAAITALGTSDEAPESKRAPGGVEVNARPADQTRLRPLGDVGVGETVAPAFGRWEVPPEQAAARQG